MRRLLPKHTGNFGYVKQPLIRNIMATQLFFFNPNANLHKYINFCQKHKIINLPDKNNPYGKYVFNPRTNTFNAENVPVAQRIQAKTNIFDKIVLQKFLNFETLFVYNEKKGLAGILHYTDYNKMPVTIFLFAQLIELEYLLRAIAKKYNFTLTDLFNFWMDNSNKPFYKRRLLQSKDFIHELNLLDRTKLQKAILDFSSVYLTDLIDLINHKKVLKISRDIQEIRNRIMHAKTLISKESGFTSTTLLRNLESFNLFFNRVLLLLNTRQQVEDLLKNIK